MHDQWIGNIQSNKGTRPFKPRTTVGYLGCPDGSRTSKHEENFYRERARDYITNVRNIENVDETH